MELFKYFENELFCGIYPGIYVDSGKIQMIYFVDGASFVVTENKNDFFAASLDENHIKMERLKITSLEDQFEKGELKVLGVKLFRIFAGGQTDDTGVEIDVFPEEIKAILESHSTDEPVQKKLKKGK